jgi:hypothetical protein
MKTMTSGVAIETELDRAIDGGSHTKAILVSVDAKQYLSDELILPGLLCLLQFAATSFAEGNSFVARLLRFAPHLN